MGEVLHILYYFTLPFLCWHQFDHQQSPSWTPFGGRFEISAPVSFAFPADFFIDTISAHYSLALSQLLDFWGSLAHVLLHRTLLFLAGTNFPPHHKLRAMPDWPHFQSFANSALRALRQDATFLLGTFLTGQNILYKDLLKIHAVKMHHRYYLLRGQDNASLFVTPVPFQLYS